MKTVKTIVKTLIIIILVTFSAMASAQTYLYPTYPGTNTRDYTKPGYIVEEDRWAEFERPRDNSIYLEMLRQFDETNRELRRNYEERMREYARD